MSEDWCAAMTERRTRDIPDMACLKLSFSNMFEETWDELTISDDSCGSVNLLPEMHIELTKTLVVPEEVTLHEVVKAGDYFRIKTLLEQGCDIEEVDSDGDTPLLVAVKKVRVSRRFVAIVSLLLSYGADPHKKDSEGWSTMDGAVARQDRELVGLLFDFMSEKRIQKWKEVKELTSQALQRLQDFYMEIKWELDSSIIPLVSTFGPSDVCSMWKSSDSLRLDSSLVGWKKLISKRRNMSIVFTNTGQQHAMVLVNHSKQIISDPLERVDPDERKAVLSDILRADPVQGEVTFHNHRITQTKNWRGRKQTLNVSGFLCVKYKVKLQARLNYKKKTRQLNSNGETGPERQVNTVKKLKATIWVSDQFPISLNDFLPMLALLSQANQSMHKLYEFMSNGSLIAQLPPRSFPVKIDIPLTMSIRAVISFINFKIMTPEPSIFELPDYEWKSRRIAQKTLSCPRKRLFLANMAV